MTKNELLAALLADLAGMTNQATSKEQAIEMGKDKYLFIEYASNYGGYRLVNVGIDKGTHYGAFNGNGCESRLKFNEMELKLRSLITGVSYGIQMNMPIIN